MMERLDQWVRAASNFVWGPFLLIPLLLLTGLFLTLRLRGIQFTQLGHSLWLALVVRKEPEGEGVAQPDRVGPAFWRDRSRGRRVSAGP